MPPLLLKVLILGDSGVGKSALMRQYVKGAFDPSYKATIGVEFLNKQLTIDGEEAKLQIWDHRRTGAIPIPGLSALPRVRRLRHRF